MEKSPKSNSILYVKLASLGDLARYVCNFDYTASNIISIKKTSGHAIFAFGEQLDGALLAYYVNVPGPEQTICYTYPSSSMQSEGTHFVNDIGSPPDHYMNIAVIAAGLLVFFAIGGKQEKRRSRP